MHSKYTIWQIGSGQSSRPYVETFINNEVALIGPGDPGLWSPVRNDDEYEGGIFVRKFANEVKEGDVFLLRRGKSIIQAIGLVASNYLYLNQFDDVNGWDLQHARRVRWYKLPEEYDFGLPLLPYTRFSRVHNPEVLNYVERFLNSPPNHWQTAKLPSLPEEEPLLEEIPEYLQNIVGVALDLASGPRYFYWDKISFGELPKEDELVAHFVVPLLKSLGWPPEQIAVKWKDIDIAIFNKLPRKANNCQFIVEAKRLGAGVEGALEQAKKYLSAIGVSRDIVVTDGIRYRLYDSQNSFAPLAYANLALLKKSAIDLFERIKRK